MSKIMKKSKKMIQLLLKKRNLKNKKMRKRRQ